jgi:urease accessory protein
MLRDLTGDRLGGTGAAALPAPRGFAHPGPAAFDGRTKRVETGTLPGYVRQSGGVALRIGPTPRGPRALDVAEHGGFRARFPRIEPGAPVEAVLINTGGGMTGGDALSIGIEVDGGAQARITTQAAEKIYRSQGPDTSITARLTLSVGSSLAWLPQETILFDAARLTRRLDVTMARDASLIIGEMIAFGRTAMGEEPGALSLDDRWSIRRDGRLVFAEALRLSGDARGLLARPALGGNARACATLVMVAPDAAELLDALREALDHPDVEAGASTFDGLLVARLVARDLHPLRAVVARALALLTRAPLPRSWQC